MSSPPTAILADRIADQLSTPDSPSSDNFWQAQSLSRGTAGIALLHLERARAGVGSWRAAHSWVTAATSPGVVNSDETSLYLGAPAICALLHTAADHVPAYASAIADLLPVVVNSVHSRVDTALTRIRCGHTATFAEYDLFRGLTGLGRLLLEHAPRNDALARILDYLVRLTYPLRLDGTTLPGWWVTHDPDPKLPTPGGHGNLGLAHGISGPLALLATALRCGVSVPGQTEAIDRICAYLDTWRHDGRTGPWWPQWIIRNGSNAAASRKHGPPRPSWCYGTPGIGRAHQLAALALTDVTRQYHAEETVAACLADPAQLALITDTTLCHGWAGVYQTTWRAACDALTPDLSAHLPHLREQLTEHGDLGEDDGFLTGTAGLGLALHTATYNSPPQSGWDSCLLIS